MSESHDSVALGELAELNPESLGANTPADFTFKYIDLSSVSFGTIDTASLGQFRFAEAPSRARRVVRDGDALFGTVRPQLRSHARVVGDGFIASTGFCVVRPKRGVADGVFLSHFLLSDEANRQAARREVGSNYPAVAERDVATFRLPRLLLEEQRRIAEILDTVDETIQATECVIAKLLRTDEAMVSTLLNDPSHQVLALSSVASLQGGFAFPSHAFSESGVGVVRMSDIDGSGFLETDSMARVAPSHLDSHTRFVLANGDWLMGMSGSVGVYAMVRSTDLPLLLNQRVGRFKVHSSSMLRQELIGLYLRAGIIQRHIRNEAVGVAQLNVSSAQVEATLVPVPLLDAQDRIIQIASESSERIQLEQARVTSLRRLRAGLAADLLSGRVRTVVE